jgi:putative ABC transport system permease protein
MLRLDHWQEVLQTLRRNRLRTFLTACGVFWGVFMLVVMLGFGKGLENGATQGFGSWALNTAGVWPEATTMAYAGRAPGRNLDLTLEDMAAVGKMDGVQKVVPRNFYGSRGGGDIVSRGDKVESFRLLGDTADWLAVEDLTVESGRFLTPDDERGTRKVAVIGARVRELLFAPDENPLGQYIKTNGTPVMVVGVHRTSVAGERAEWMNGRIFLPRATVALLRGRGTRINQLTFLVAPGHDAATVEESVKALLRRRHAVHPDDRPAFGSWNRAREYAKVSRLFTGIAALTWIVGVMTLLAGVIGVSNIMMIAVSERTKEIGIRKTVGATPLSIIGQIVTEATVLTGLAGYAGLVAGVGVVEAAARIMARLPVGDGPGLFGRPEIDLAKALVAAAVLTVAGAVAGLAPARNAVAIRPVEALAHE